MDVNVNVSSHVHFNANPSCSYLFVQSNYVAQTMSYYTMHIITMAFAHSWIQYNIVTTPLCLFSEDAAFFSFISKVELIISSGS